MGPQPKSCQQLFHRQCLSVGPAATQILFPGLTIYSAGDAAHAFPPTGGLGMNTGLADVHNLAYKIAAVHQGLAESSLLESYHDERRPIAMINAAQSVKNGKAIFSFLKTLGTAGIDDVDQARANLLKSIHDPEKQEMIEREVEGQREHFDNVSNDTLKAREMAQQFHPVGAAYWICIRLGGSAATCFSLQGQVRSWSPIATRLDQLQRVKDSGSISTARRVVRQGVDREGCISTLR